MFLVIYHANCNDGSLAAYLACKHFEIDGIYPMAYGEALPRVFLELDEKDEVLIVDFSLTSEEYERLLSTGAKVRTVDHHEPKFEALRCMKEYPNHTLVLNADLSGCEIVRNLFPPKKEDISFPKDTLDAFVEMVGERDRGLLWRKDTPVQIKENMEKYNAFLSTFGGIRERVHSRYPNLIDLQVQKDRLIEGWEDIFDYSQYHVKGIGARVIALNRARIKDLMGKVLELEKYCVVFSSEYQLFSDLGNEVAAKFKKPCIILYQKGFFSWGASVRSNEDCEISALEICEMFGGGGHKFAGGISNLDKSQIEFLSQKE